MGLYAGQARRLYPAQIDSNVLRVPLLTCMIYLDQNLLLSICQEAILRHCYASSYLFKFLLR